MEKKKSFYNLEETLRQATEQFCALDPAEIAANAAVKFDPDRGALLVPFLSESFSVRVPDGRVFTQERQDASLYLAIIILHYLITADGTPLSESWIAYRHLPGGDIYTEPFQKRAIFPFLKSFGQRPADFAKAAAALEGYPSRTSGVSMVIPVLPRVPLCFTIWPGDEEMPASANILFDQSASHYLATEDYAHLPGIVIRALQEQLK